MRKFPVTAVPNFFEGLFPHRVSGGLGLGAEQVDRSGEPFKRSDAARLPVDAPSAQDFDLGAQAERDDEFRAAAPRFAGQRVDEAALLAGAHRKARPEGGVGEFEAGVGEGHRLVDDGQIVDVRRPAGGGPIGDLGHRQARRVSRRDVDVGEFPAFGGIAVAEHAVEAAVIALRRERPELDEIRLHSRLAAP